MKPGVGIALGVGLALVAWIAPDFWKTMPTYLSYPLLGVGLLLVAWGLWHLWKRRGGIVADDPKQLVVSGNANVISVGQTGGQTAHTIVNQAPLPRHVDQNISKQIIGELRAIGKKRVEVKAQIGDAEAYQYASEIAEIFKQAGWDVEPPMQSMFTVPMVGVLVSTRSEHEIPVLALFIANSFKKHGIDVGANIDSSMPMGQFWLVIGSKKP